MDTTLIATIFSPFSKFFSTIFGGRRRGNRSRRRHRTDQQNQQSPQEAPAASASLVDSLYNIASRRKVPCRLLFIGESFSGKSTAIANLFHVKRENIQLQPKQDNDFQIWSLPTDSNNTSIPLELVEVPGLLGKNSVEQNAKILLSLASFMRKEAQSRLPTVAFVVARLDDNRFEGEQSDFSLVLKAITLIRSYITDSTCSNMVLLLTHSDKRDVHHDKDVKISRYQLAFQEIFKASVSCIEIGNTSKYLDLVKNLSQIANKKKRRECDLLQALVDDLGLARRLRENEFSLRRVRVDELVPPRKALINRVAEKLISSVIDRGGRIDSNSDDDDDGESKSQYGLYFVPYLWLANSQVKRALPQYTCLSPGSKITLADKTCIKVADILMGDRVLSYGSNKGFVTNVTKVRTTHDNPWLINKKIGMIYCKRSIHSRNMNSVDDFLYLYRHDAFRLVNASQVINDSKPSNNIMYHVEIDNGEGSFIVDGYVCVSHNIRSRPNIVGEE